MNEFTRSLLYVALLVCIPIVTACIQKGIAVIDAAERAQCARGIQKALGEGRFARVDMGEYPDGEFFHGLSSEKAPRRGASVFLYDTMLLRPRQMEKGCWRQPFRSQLL